MAYDRKKPTRPVRGEKRNDFGTVRPDKGPRPWGSKPEIRRDRPAGGDRTLEPREKPAAGGTEEKKPRVFNGPGGNKVHFAGTGMPRGGSRFPRRGDAGQPRGNGPRPETKKERPGTTDGMPARRIALDVIRKVTENGAYASLALDEKLRGCTLSGADRRFAARLVYDTLDRLRWLDHALSQVMARPDTDCSSGPLKTTQFSPPMRTKVSISWVGMEEFFTPMTLGFFRISVNRDGGRATPASWGIL